MRVTLSRDGVLGTATVHSGVTASASYSVWLVNHHGVSRPAANSPPCLVWQSVAILEFDELQVVTS